MGGLGWGAVGLGLGVLGLGVLGLWVLGVLGLEWGGGLRDGFWGGWDGEAVGFGAGMEWGAVGLELWGL